MRYLLLIYAEPPEVPPTLEAVSRVFFTAPPPEPAEGEIVLVTFCTGLLTGAGAFGTGAVTAGDFTTGFGAVTLTGGVVTVVVVEGTRTVVLGTVTVGVVTLVLGTLS